MDTELRAYAAGIIDGEGSISATSATIRGHTYWKIRLKVEMTEPEAVNRLASMFGGNVHKHTRALPNVRPTFNWTLQGARAHAALLALRDYLLVKREQCDAAISFFELGMHPGGVPIDIQQQRAVLAERLQDLNGSAWHRKRLERKAAQC